MPLECSLLDTLLQAVLFVCQLSVLCGSCYQAASECNQCGHALCWRAAAAAAAKVSGLQPHLAVLSFLKQQLLLSSGLLSHWGAGIAAAVYLGTNMLRTGNGVHLALGTGISVSPMCCQL